MLLAILFTSTRRPQTTVLMLSAAHVKAISTTIPGVPLRAEAKPGLAIEL